MQVPVVRILAGFILLAVAPVACMAQESPQPQRTVVPPGAIRHEIGFCYIAGMDFGEEGDKTTGNNSGLLVFEDGEPLGPARALHQDIREQGGGRYSHWTRNGLYFSASDNSDPRTNGRTYHVASTNPDSTLGGLDGLQVEHRRHTEVIRQGRHEYSLLLGGTLDHNNTRTRHNSNIVIGFQPNLSLTIANTGETPVFWPKLIANGVRDWSTYESLLEDFTRGATNDQEIAYFIYETARQNRYHSSPLFADNEFHDPVKMFNSYGLNLCDDMGYVGASLFKHAGLGRPKYDMDPKVRCLHGHMMCEAVVDNEYQFLDIDIEVFYLDRENERPVSGDACARDHDLVRREPHYGPVFPVWQSSDAVATLFGPDDRETALFLREHEMSFALRPGERAVFRWDNVGKWAAQSEQWSRRPLYFGNSRFIYTPRLAPEHFREGVREAVDIIPATAEGAFLAGASEAARLVYPVEIPWAMCGGALRAAFVGTSPNDRFALDIVLDGQPPTRIWEGQGAGEVAANVSLDQALQPHRSPAKYRYEVVVTLASADGGRGAHLRALEIETDVMAAPLSLPALSLGENTFVYTDQAEGPREITITHEWQESSAISPPPSPATLQYPPPGETIRDSIVTFRWPEVEGCRAYHLQVSRRADFRIPYRPAYDVIVNTTDWTVPYTGMFSPDTLYHVRLRARDRWGVWSEWSQPWTFMWEGPRVPLHVRAEAVQDGFMLHWEPNPRGTRPVAYDVYGSDEKGFSVHKTEYESYKRGRVPANFLGRTTETRMLVVSPEPTHDNMNHCYYRVVAVDEHGTESICSDYAELPHPHFWSRPPRTAQVGRELSYRPGILTSLNDAQHRYEPPNQKFWDIEENTFSLAAAPEWLSIDPETGEVSGTPDAPGVARVEIEVRNQFGGHAVQAFDLEIR